MAAQDDPRFMLDKNMDLLYDNCPHEYAMTATSADEYAEWRARAKARLVELLGREDASMRSQVARALGDAGSRTAVPALIEGVRDDDPAVRQAAMGSLAKLKDRSAVPALIAALDDPNRGVRRVAMRALAAIAGQFPGNTPEDWKRWWKQQGGRSLP